MTRKTMTAKLPRLTPNSGHERMRDVSPRDLRGAQYTKLQDTRHKDKSGLLPTLSGDEEHPTPYYVSEEVSFPALTEVPWKHDEKKKMKEQAEDFGSDKKAQGLLISDLIDDVVSEEIVAAASVVLEHIKYKDEEDRHAAEVVEEELMMPGVQREVWVVVWTVLYDLGRSLSDEQYEDLKKRESELHLDNTMKNALLAHVLEGENWEDNLTEEKLLSDITWDALVYHYHRNLQENGLAKNLALQIYQERVVCGAAGGEVVTETMKALESALSRHDEREKVDCPPRKG